jgi:exonuclease III
MRGEFQLKKGPKISMIRKLVTPHTDFLILTEIRADQRAIMNTKIKYGIRPSHFSTSQHPRGGVLICANQNHKKMAGSERQSTTPGHIAAAVYEVKKSRTVVLGIYGISENNDRLSANTIREASSILTDLKILYNTQHVIVAGDFNAVLEPEDSSSRDPQMGHFSCSPLSNRAAQLDRPCQEGQQNRTYMVQKRNHFTVLKNRLDTHQHTHHQPKDEQHTHFF